MNTEDKFFQSAFKFSSIGMAILAPSGQWLMVNDRLCSTLGYSREEFLKTTFQDLTHPEDLEADLNFVNDILSGKIDTYQMEKRYFHKKGHIVWGLLSVSLIRDDNNVPLYFISQIQDITQLKKAERYAALYEVTAKLGHQINNPLTIITINCEVIDQLMKEEKPDYKFVEELNVKSAIATSRITNIMKELKATELQYK